MLIHNGFVKSFVCKAREPGKVEAYFLYGSTFPAKRNAADELFTKPLHVICVQ